jgi:Zn-dependent M28 family amino/carboxypeptidase
LAERYIDETWQVQGYEVSRQDYRVAGTVCTNLEVTCPGIGQALILVGAHYDSVLGSPGANDNGSGVAVLLELSRRLRDHAPALGIRFVAFTNEEPPFFFTEQQGSMVYARAARARRDDIRLMIALETMGCYSEVPGSQHYPPLLRHFYPDRGDFLALVCDLRSRRAMRRLAATFREVSDFPLQHLATFRSVPGVAWSDHLSFWRQGYRALMVTDTAFYRYAHYHSASDTPDKVDYPRLARVTDGLADALLRLAARGV